MALDFSSPSSRVVYSNIGNLNAGAKSILLDFFMPSNALQANNDFFSATRNAGNDTFQNFLLQLSDEGGTVNSIRSAHFGSATGQAYTASNVLTAGEWSRIVWTCSDCATPSPSNTKIYVNAVSQPVFGGSSGSGLGATNGDICIGNRAHLDRGVKGQIARFAVLDRVASESEVQEFEAGLKPIEIFSETELLLAPKTYFLESWASETNGNLNAAALSNVTHISDPTYGVASVRGNSVVFTQNGSVSNSSVGLEGSLVGSVENPIVSQKSIVSNQVSSSPIRVVGDFDGGTVNEHLSEISFQANQTDVTLIPRKFTYRDSSADWLTVQALVKNVGGAGTVRFKVSETDFDLSQRFTSETKLWWRPTSGTKDDWSLFDHNVLVNGTVTSYNSSSFDVPDILVGDQPGYYYEDIAADVSKWLQSPHVASPLGADADGSISILSSVEDENGRLSGALKQYALRVSDVQGPSHPGLNKKIKILVFANVHPGEMVAKWSVKGFIDWLISSSSDATSARRNFEVYVVWVNSSGLFLGHPVGSVFVGPQAHKNLNRDWGDFDLEATRQVRDWVSQHVAENLQYVIDFHNLTWSNVDKIFRDPSSISIAFSNAVDAHYLDPIAQQNNTAPSGFTTHYFKNQYGVDGATLEPRRGSNNLAAYQNFGEAVGRGLTHMLSSGAFGHFGVSSTQLRSSRVSLLASADVRLGNGRISNFLW